MRKFFCLILVFLGFRCTVAEDEVEVVFVPTNNIEQLSGDEIELINLINDFRIENNRVPLEIDATHYIIAKERNEVDNFPTDTISHSGLYFTTTPLRDLGLIVGENLGLGYTSPETTMAAWLASDGHRNLMLKEYWRYTGLAISVKPQTGIYYYCQLFTRRR